MSRVKIIAGAEIDPKPAESQILVERRSCVPRRVGDAHFAPPWTSPTHALVQREIGNGRIGGAPGSLFGARGAMPLAAASARLGRAGPSGAQRSAGESGAAL